MPSWSPKRPALAGLLAALTLATGATTAGAAPTGPAGATHHPAAPAAPAPAPAAAPTAAAAPAGGPGQGGGENSAPLGSDTNSLVSNGLGSPLCFHRDQLAPAEQDACARSGIVGSQYPIDRYGVDSNILTGTFGLNGNALSNALANLIVSPAWMILIYLLQVLIVGVEWAFSLNLLDPTTLGALGTRMDSAMHAFTYPWLPAVLAVAGAGFAYRALVHRAVEESVR